MKTNFEENARMLEIPATQTRKKIAIKKIAQLSLMLCFLVLAKYKFGFNFDGIEILTSLFLLFGMFISLLDMLILVICFNLIIFLIYGFGTWWAAYWVIWPIEILLLNLFRRFICKNNITFGIFAGFCGFSIIGFYFLSDLIFYGKAFAIMELSTALPVNAIEGVTNLIFSTIAYYPFIMMMKKLQFNPKTSW